MSDAEKCCELMDLKEWNGKTVEWKNKPFAKERYFAFFFMPLGADKIIMKKIAELSKKELWGNDMPRIIWRNEGLFGGEMLFALKKNDSSICTEKISGKFFTMSYEGKGYGDIAQWHKAFGEDAKKRNLNIKERMTEYATCPLCAKEFGKIQAVIYGRL
jgi:hypothetical protein